MRARQFDIIDQVRSENRWAGVVRVPFTSDFVLRFDHSISPSGKINILFDRRSSNIVFTQPQYEALVLQLKERALHHFKQNTTIVVA